MPTLLILLLAKTVLRLNRVLGVGGGSALPGLIAEKLSPGILRKLASRIPGKIIIITGTNGKTTTAKMAAEILRREGHQPITNSGGSNLSRGIVSALIERATLLGIRGKTGLFEVDEAAMPSVAQAVHPDVVVVLNLFRDQLDRYGELDRTATLIGSAIAQGSPKVYLCADDPLVASLASYARQPDKVRYFGVKQTKVAKLKGDHTADSIHCPICSRPLRYSKQFFAHIGHYSCPSKDFRRPVPSLELANVPASPGIGQKLEIVLNGTRQQVNLRLPGLYNAYNALGALAVSDALGILPLRAALALEQVAAAFGRVERVEIGGKYIYLLLVKNPTGFNQMIQTFLTSTKRSKPTNVLIAINDNFADGRDVSWLWDAAVEDIKGNLKIMTAGSRAYDMALRLKYAGFKSEPETELKAALERLLSKVAQGETAYILPTYTAMLEIRKLLAKHADLKGFWV